MANNENSEAHGKHAPGALSGLKVLDLSRFIAGPHCGMILGDLGAEVVKLERREVGDDVRALKPQIASESLYFLVFNRNKQSLTIDFRNREAQEILRRLVVESDILIENFRPGTMEKMGLGWEQVHALNPRLIMARISGYGQQGSRAAEPCFDAVAQASSGLMSLTGQADGPPLVAGTFIVDYVTSLYAATGILAALEHQRRSGEGQLVDVSLVGAGVSLLLTAIPEQGMLKQTMSRVGNRDRYSAPAQTFKTRDGQWVYLLAGNDTHFPRLAGVMKRPDLLDDPRFASIAARLAHVAEIERIVGEFVAELDAEAVIALTREAEVPCAKVATIQDVVSDPYMYEAGHLTSFEHQMAGTVPIQALPIRMSLTPTVVRRAPPILGEQSEQILVDWLGISREEIVSLRQRAVI